MIPIQSVINVLLSPTMISNFTPNAIESISEFSKNEFYFEVSKILYLKFKGVFLQKKNFKFNFKTICIL